MLSYPVPIKAFLLFASLWYCAVSSTQSVPLVTTSLGTVRGALMKTEKGLDLYAFRGIRYAEAPTGDKRFRAPTPVRNWKGEYDATEDGSICPQQLSQSIATFKQSEDCLFLNVYSRNLSETASGPVVVYLHGGSNEEGSGHSLRDIGPGYLLDADIVFVTFNYRLGPFGFLSTSSPEAPGNYGFLDQVMVLKWVHEHIVKFGGNPDSVTLFGLSAGGMSVTLHMASPLSMGLFHKAIVMSGSGTSDIILDSVKWTQKLALDLSCPIYNPSDVLSCLRKFPWQTIINACSSWKVYNFPNMKWGYQIDGHFMEDKLTNLFYRGNFTKIPILTGISKEEFNYWVYNEENNFNLLNDISINFDKYAPWFFLHNFSSHEKVSKVQSFYLGNKTINDQELKNFGKIFSDSSIGYPVQRFVDLSRKHVDVYYYRFDYYERLGCFIDANGNLRGSCHADEAMYFSGIEINGSKLSITDPEWFMVEWMVGMISSFAQRGFPQAINGTKWLPANKTVLQTMYIDKKPKMGFAPFTERFRLWDELFPVNDSTYVYGSTFIISFMVIVQLLFY